LQAGTAHTAIVCGGLLVLGLGAVLLMREPEATVAAPAATKTSSQISFARPWTTFFARNGRSSSYFLAAIACYALAGSIAEYLGRHGYTVDLLRTNLRDYDAAVGDALSLVGTQTTTLTAAGILAGMLIAFSTRPARAFRIMMISIATLVASFVACKVALGFTVYTLPMLFVLRTLIWSGAFIIFISVAAQLTARPNTAGHVAIISVFSGAFWISDEGLTALAEPFGTSWLAAIAAVAAMVALFLMRIAARVARPAVPAG
jgi:hypothetical protein